MIQPVRDLPPWYVQSCHPMNTPCPVLFRESVETWHPASQVSRDEIMRWQDRGWIPTIDWKHDLPANDHRLKHLEMVRDLARSGLEDRQITAMLGVVPRGHQLCPIHSAFSFRFGWVEPAFIPDPGEDDEDAECRIDLDDIDSWIEDADLDSLSELRDLIEARIRQYREGPQATDTPTTSAHRGKSCSD